MARPNAASQSKDQAASAADQTTSDTDQTTSDTDQTLSDLDQAQAEADQRASDRDQAASDRDPGASAESHHASRSARAEGTLARHATRMVRGQVSVERDQSADRRDRIATKRDRVADQRDRVADQRDQAAEEADRVGERLEAAITGDDPRALEARAALATMRLKAAAQRERAAADRGRAAVDREAASADREHLLLELEHAHLDDLTGAYRRGMGEIALVHEIERAGRSRKPLVLAYLDCDGLKETNDRRGHTAGDALLRDLVVLMRSKLRPYDPIVRWGGDEFICTMSNTDLETARARFEWVREALAEKHGGGGATAGLVSLGEGETLEALMERANAELREAKRERYG